MKGELINILLFGPYKSDIVQYNFNPPRKEWSVCTAKVFPIYLGIFQIYDCKKGDATEYSLFYSVQKTLDRGQLILPRNSCVKIQRLEWYEDSKYNFFNTRVAEEKLLGDFSRPFDSFPCPDHARFTIVITPKKPKVLEPQYQTEKVEIFYSLPINEPEMVLPYHDEENVAEIFGFAGYFNKRTEDQFVLGITEFLEYDIDFYEEDGSRAEWWVDLLKRLKNGQELSVDRDGVGKPYRY
jgi:hypothetical protein